MSFSRYLTKAFMPELLRGEIPEAHRINAFLGLPLNRSGLGDLKGGALG